MPRILNQVKRLTQLAMIAMGVAVGQPVEAQTGLPFVLPEDFETRAALAAAPATISEDAGVYVLGPQGYVQTRPSKNGFNCLVERAVETDAVVAGRELFAPQCFDEASSKTMLEAMIRRSKLVRVEGMTVEEARADVSSDPELTPRVPGIIYMASALNLLPDPTNRQGEFASYPPHVMFVAPNRDDDSVSGGIAAMPGGMLSGWPFLAGPARPDGLIIVPLDGDLQNRIASDQSDLVKQLMEYVPYRRLELTLMNENGP